MKYIAIVECTDAGGIEIGMAVIQMGYQPLFLLDSQLYRADLGFSLQNFPFLNVNTESVEAIVCVLESIRDQIAAVGSLVDSRIAIAAEVAQRLGVPGPDPACIVLKDKAKVAQLVSEYSSPTFSLGAEAEENKNILCSIFNEKNVVAKQRKGCGGIGIKFMFSEKEKVNFLEGKNNVEDWIIQEYFDGKLFSIEGWRDNSEVNFLGWTSRKKIGNTETEFRFEGYGTIPEVLTEKAKEAVCTLFQRSQLKKGWFHIEFLIDVKNSKLVLIDANIGRVGGAMLPHVLSMAFSKRPSEIYQHALEIQIFGKTNISINTRSNIKKIYKCICFGSPHEAVIEDVLLPKYPLETQGLRMVRILGPGDYVSQMGNDDMSWIGFVAGEEKNVDYYASNIKIKAQDVYYSAVY